MQEIIKVDSIELVYQSAESLSIKKAVKMLFNRDFKKTFLMHYKALDGVSFSIKKGSVYGIIGNNGAGKSTLLRILSGAMSPTSGHIERNYNTINLLALGVGFTRDMTGVENIYLNGMLLGFEKKKIDDKLNDIIEYSELGDFIYKPMKTYSSGMVSRLGFSIAINLKPEVLLVDEILSVGDVKFREKSFSSIRKYIEDENTTVVIVSHSMQQIKDLCNYVVWIEKGHLIAKGDTHNILDAYTKVNKELISLEEAKKETSENIKVVDNQITFDLSTYKLCLENPEERRLFGRIYDSEKSFQLGRTNLRVTVRRLTNDDLFIYFTISGKRNIQIFFELDQVKDRLNFDRYYKKPECDPVLGEIRATGPSSFFDLAAGSMVVSKIIHFNNLEVGHENKESFGLKEHVCESNYVKLLDPEHLEVRVQSKSDEASFFIILSKTKIFRSFVNMKTYMDYYFSSIENNVNINPFFQLPEGTYTKVPCLGETDTQNIYEYNPTNGFNADLLRMFLASNERFYSDLMSNSVVQAYMYKEKQKEVFLTDSNTEWAKNVLRVNAPYFDTKLNCRAVDFLNQFIANNPVRNRLKPMKSLADFICSYYESGRNLYKLNGGIFFPSYLCMDSTAISYAALGDQAILVRVLLQAYRKYKGKQYKDVAEKILRFIEAGRECWIDSESGNLYRYVSYEGNNLLYHGEDNVYETLSELLMLQEVYCSLYKKVQKDIEYLTDSKIRYLKGTGYDIYNEGAPAAPRESIDIRSDILKLLERIYEKDTSL